MRWRHRGDCIVMSDSRALDQISRQSIREELTTNILVEAGAGSGKTQMLAERMAAGVAAGVYKVEHMVAVTFTRKAASELRGRFHLALEAQLGQFQRQKPQSKTVATKDAERIRLALSNLERFFAGTIHSFCARLLRERPVESGVSPGFTELDEAQDLELRQRTWREFISNARSAGDPDMLALLDASIRPKDLDFAFATFCANEDVHFPPGDATCPDAKAALRRIEAFWKELQKHFPGKVDPATTCRIQKAAREFEGRLRVSRHRLDRPSIIASLLDLWNCESTIVQKWWADSTPEKKRLSKVVQQLHADFHAAVVDPYLKQWRQYIYRLSVTLLSRARCFTSEERRRLNSLNYGDLLNLTAKVLRENQAVREALQQKFQFILVDEFQDTDPVQAEIVFWLAAAETNSSSGERPSQRDWKTLSLRPGALFVVGDPKQSIYRFRRADIDIYNTVRRRLSDPQVGKVVPLTLNYRSVLRLCNWANEVFQTRFPATPTVYAPRFTSLDAHNHDKQAGGVFTLTHNCEPSDLPTTDAQKIATYIRSEVNAGRRRFNDFLILTRKKTDRIAPYADALKLLNIPLEVSGAGAFGDSGEVSVLITLLRALSDPQDALSLVAVLRGPLFGISDQELFAFKQAGGWFSLFQGQGDESARSPASPTAAALAALNRYYRWTRVLPAAAALDRILEDTGYLALSATTSGGVAAGDVLHAVDRVRQVMERGGSLADAAEALEADREANNEIESLPLEPGRPDVVRLMNLHKAKGLEAEVVFLADPAGGVRLRADVHIERAERETVGWLKIVRRNEGSYVETLLGEHPDWAAWEAAEKPYLEAEEDRLLYVAATRARQMLVISRSVQKLRSPAWGALNDFLSQAVELPVPMAAAASPVSPLDCGKSLLAEVVDQQKVAHGRARAPSWAVKAATAEARHIARMVRSAAVAEDDPTKVVSSDTPSHRADAGVAWGTLIHGLLEHAMRQRDVSPEDLRRLGMWLTVDEPQLRSVLDQAVETVLAVAKAPFWIEAKRSVSSVETPFAFADDANTIVMGVIDLLFGAGKSWRIIDYKTGAASPELALAYQEQLKIYEQALAKVGLQHVTSSIQPL